MSISQRIEQILAEISDPLALDQICARAFGQITERNLSTTRTVLSRLDDDGRLIKHPRKYALKSKERK